MKPDPNFPDRPTHPDFERLSKAVIANDEAVESPEGPDFIDVLNRYVDPDSVLYLLDHRWEAVRHQGAELTARKNLYKAAWVDGFAVAMRMVHDQAKVWDGQTRDQAHGPQWKNEVG